MPYEFITKNGLISQGNVTVTGSLITSQNVTASNISASGTVIATSFTGSLLGTSSWASNALTASFLPVGTYNITSSWAQNVVSASFATTAQTANALNTANSYTITNLTASGVVRAAQIAEKVVTFTPLTGSITGAPAWYRIISGSGVLDSGRVRMSANYDNSRSDIEFTYAVRNYDTDGAGAFINITRASTYNTLFNAVRVIETGNLAEPYAIDVLIGNYLNNTTPGTVTCLYESQFIGAVLDTPTFVSASATGSNIVKTVYTTYTSGYPRIGPTYSDGLAVANYQGQLTVGYRGNYAYNTPSTLNYALLVSGSVGIGTSSPTQKLDVIGGTISTDSELYSLGGRLSLYRSAGDSFIDWSSGRSLGFRTETTVGGGSASEKMRIDTNGNVGIGTTVPGALLDVSYGDYQNAGTIRIGADLGTNTSRTNNTRKYGAITLFPYNNASASVQAIGIDAQGPAVTGLTIGGGGTGFASPTQIQFYTTSSTIVPGAERMRIDSSGNVGIGTTTPNNKLHVYNSAGSSTTASNAIAIFEQNSNAGIQVCVPDASEAGLFFSRNGAAYYSAVTRNGTDLLLKNGSSTAVTINSSRYVGIGTSSPSYILHVNAGVTEVAAQSVAAFEKQSSTDGRIALFSNSTGSGYSSYIYIGSNPGRDWKIGKNVLNSGTTGHFQITNDLNALKMQINASDESIIFPSGSVGIGTTSPGSKLQINDNTPVLTIRANDGGVSRKAYIDFYTTFFNYPSDVGARRTSTIVTGFDSGTWGTEFLAFNVGSGSTNDAALLPIERVRIDGSGNVGVGTSTIIGKLQVNSTSAPYYGPATSSATANGIFILGNTTADVVNTFGVDASATAYAWIQPRKTGTATYYSLALNPNGGNVGIGTTTPGALLELSSSTAASLLNIKGARGNNILYVSASGNVAINSSVFDSLAPEALLISGSTYNIISADTNINTYGQVHTQNRNAGTAASSDLVATNDTGTELGNYVDLGINSSGYTAAFIGNANDGYLYNTGSQFYIGNASPGRNLYFFAGGTSNTASMMLSASGNVGIGATSPNAKLDVRGYIVSDVNGNAVESGFYLGSSAHGLRRPVGSNDVYLHTTTGNLYLGTTGNTSQQVTVLNSGNVGIGTVTPAAKLEITGSSNSALLNIKSPISGAILYVSGSGAVGIGTSNVGAFTLQVSGSFGATTKSFIIDHPTKAGKKLMYGSLESPYHGIRLTGRDTLKEGKCKVELPDYIYKLILHDSINIQLTGIKCNKTLYVDDINIPENYFTIAYDKAIFESYKDYDFFWDFTAIRADVPELTTEL